jgi:hypothetical protein
MSRLRDPRWCYQHNFPGNDVSPCQLVDAAARFAEQVNPGLQLLAELTGAADIERCAEKAMLNSCALAAASIIPGGRALRASITAKRSINLLGTRGDHVIYRLLKKDAEGVWSPNYVGIARADRLAARLKRHSEGIGPLKGYRKDFDRHVVIAQGLSENKAKAIETYLIENYAPKFTPGGLLHYNDRRSINPVNQPDLYSQAHRYATLWANIVGLR